MESDSEGEVTERRKSRAEERPAAASRNPAVALLTTQRELQSSFEGSGGQDCSDGRSSTVAEQCRQRGAVCSVAYHLLSPLVSLLALSRWRWLRL